MAGVVIGIVRIPDGAEAEEATIADEALMAEAAALEAARTEPAVVADLVRRPPIRRDLLRVLGRLPPEHAAPSFSGRHPRTLNRSGREITQRLRAVSGAKRCRKHDVPLDMARPEVHNSLASCSEHAWVTRLPPGGL